MSYKLKLGVAKNAPFILVSVSFAENSWLILWNNVILFNEYGWFVVPLHENWISLLDEFILFNGLSNSEVVVDKKIFICEKFKFPLLSFAYNVKVLLKF